MKKYETVTSPLPLTSQDEQHKSKKSGYRLPELALHFSERRLLLIIIDILLLNALLLISLTFRSDFNMSFTNIGTGLRWFILISLIWLICGSIFNIYDLKRAARAFPSFKACCSTVLMTVLIYWMIPYITPALPASRTEAIIFPALALVGLGAWRVTYARVFVQPEFQQRALIVGAGEAARSLVQIILQLEDSARTGRPGSGYKLLGFVDDRAYQQKQAIEDLPVLGSYAYLLELVEKLRPTELIIALGDLESRNNEIFQAILACRELGIAVTTMGIVYERVTGQVPVEHVGWDLSIALPLAQPGTHRLYIGFRRIIDVLAGLIGCLVLIILVPIIWLLNLFGSPGPLFYRQERVGEGGKLFSILKFRSMLTNAEKTTGAIWASEKDPRITRVGNFLRRTRLDEIPQFWNILKGEMSLVGPRPERPYFVTQLVQKYPLYRTRHAVKPGLTGWAQVKYRYGASVADTMIKLQYDLYYIKHQSLLLDFAIILKTIGVVLGFKGR